VRACEALLQRLALNSQVGSQRAKTPMGLISQSIEETEARLLGLIGNGYRDAC